MSVFTLEAKLERSDTTTPWGFRMQGGKDFSSPLTIQRVTPGSLAAKCGLQSGDIILKIGTVSADSLKHKDAQDSIVTSGNKLDLLLHRGGAPTQSTYDTFNTPAQPFTNSFQNATPAPSYSAPKQNYNAAPKPFGSTFSSNVDNLTNQTQNISVSSKPASQAPSYQPASQAPSYQPASQAPSYQPENLVPKYQPSAAKYEEEGEKPDTSQQQSRTFRLLKGLMDDGQEAPTAMKPTQGAPPVAQTQARPGQKETVKGIGNFQYNSPINMYSSDNVADTFQGQSRILMDMTGLDGSKNGNDSDVSEKSTKLYRPSETYKLIHEREGSGDATEPESVHQTHSKTFSVLQKQLDGAPLAVPFDPLNPKGGATPSWAPAAKPASRPPPAPAAPAAAPTQPWKPSPAPVAAPAAPAAPVAAPTQPWKPSPAPVAAQAAPKWNPPGPGPTKASIGMPPRSPGASGPIRGKKGEAKMRPGDNRVPMCSSCGGQIRGPFVLAMGQTWCPDHFVCANPQCGQPLVNVGFIEEAGKLYCERDYELYFAPRCAKCGEAVVVECVNALQKQWHPACFLCSQCNQPIGGSDFHVEDGKPFCEKDWATMFQTMCSGCSFPIEPGDRWVEAMNKNWHSECFNCSTCQTSLEGNAFYAKAGKPYCKKHAR